jgi:phage-related protein
MASRRKERYSVVLAGVNKVAAPVRAINRQIESITKPIRKVARAVRSLGKEAGFGKLGGAVKGLAGNLSKLALGATAAVTGLFLALQKTAGSLDDIGKLTARIDFPVEEFQEWKTLAQLAGSEGEHFDKAMQGLAQRVGELKAGTGSLNTLLSKIDPELARDVASATNTADAFELIVDAMRKLPQASQQAALANAAFGRSGKAIVNLADTSAAKLEEMRAGIRSGGGIISEEAIRRAEAFQDAMLLVRQTIGNVWAEIAGGLFPVVVDMAEALREWTSRNREMIVSGAASFFRELVEVGKQVFSVLRQIVPPTIEIIKKMGGLRTVLIVLTGVVLAPLVGSIIAVGAALGSTAGLVIAVGTAIGIAISALVANWESIRATIVGIVDSIRDRVVSLWEMIPEPLRDVLASGAGFIAGGGLAGYIARQALPEPAAAAAGGLGGEATLTVKLDQDGKLAGAELDDGGAGIELEDGGTMGGAF